MKSLISTFYVLHVFESNWNSGLICQPQQDKSLCLNQVAVYKRNIHSVDNCKPNCQADLNERFSIFQWIFFAHHV